MIIDLDRTIELYTISKKQREQIDPKEFMQKISIHKKYIRTLINEWTMKSQRSRFQKLLNQYVAEGKNMNDIFEPFKRAFGDSNITQFKDKLLSDKKIIVSVLKSENISIENDIFNIPLMDAYIGMILGELEIKNFRSVYGLLEC